MPYTSFLVRCNLAGADLNRQYKHAVKEAFPTVHHVKMLIAKLLEDQHGYIDLQNIPENKYYSMDQNPDEEEKL